MAERDNPDTVPPGTPGSGESRGRIEGKPRAGGGGTGKVTTGIGGSGPPPSAFCRPAGNGHAVKWLEAQVRPGG